jgi:hypothetical protein
MLIFILWRDKKPDQRRTLARVGPALGELFEPILGDGPGIHSRDTNEAKLVWLELPVERWRPPLVERDGERFALAGEYPVAAGKLLRERGLSSGPDRTLLDIAGQFAGDPSSLLHDLVPPFSLVWSNGDGATCVQSDALGQAQLFEYEDDNVYALTNRLTALQTLGVPLEPVPVEWAARFCTGWFPLELTGFEGVRHVTPGTRIRLDQRGVSHERFDVLQRWIHPDRMSVQDCLELAETSMRGVLEGAIEQWVRPNVGLSGGWDSRVVVSLLRDLGADMSLRVRGSPERYDVMIAAELARVSGFKLRINNTGGYPPEDLDQLRRSMQLALRWQAGNLSTKKHKTFLARRDRLEPGLVNVMGQHSGIGKADFVMKTKAWELDPSQYEDAMVRQLVGTLEPYLHPDLREPVKQLWRDAYRQADRYDLEGVARMHFFFLFEYTRRWASGAMAAQPGQVVTPFLNPGFIRAAYGFPQEEIRNRPFHKHILAKYAQEWKDVPFEDQVTQADVDSGRIKPVQLDGDKAAFHEGAFWKQPKPHRVYSNAHYWRSVARPLAREARRSGGFWTEILDPGLKDKNTWDSDTWKRAVDPMVLSYLLHDSVTVPSG